MHTVLNKKENATVFGVQGFGKSATRSEDEKKDEKIKDDIKRGRRRNQTNNEFLIRFKSFCNFKFCHGGCAGIF